MGAYLKALAVFRLVSEQADEGALGWWEGKAFCLQSGLDGDALVQFFLNDYSPTPILAPWNAGSGFYEGDRTKGMDAILKSTAERFCDYREAIQKLLAHPTEDIGFAAFPQAIACGLIEACEGEWAAARC